jgi:hypothetical protein
MTATNKTVRPQLTENGVKAIGSDNGVKHSKIWACAIVCCVGIVFGAWTAMVSIQRDEHVRTTEIQVLKK